MFKTTINICYPQRYVYYLNYKHLSSIILWVGVWEWFSWLVLAWISYKVVVKIWPGYGHLWMTLRGTGRSISKLTHFHVWQVGAGC